MARNATANFTTATQTVTEGTRYTTYRASLRQSGNVIVSSQMVPFGVTVAQFQGVSAGTYFARLELSNADGTRVGPGVDTPSAVVPNDDMVLEVPIAGTLIVAPLA